MHRRHRIASFLIGLFVLNGVLCPCGPLPLQDAGEAAVTVQQAHAGHTMAGAMDMADCHTEATAENCDMPESGDAEAYGSAAERSYETAKALSSLRYPGLRQQAEIAQSHTDPPPEPRPPATPVHSRDRLLI